MKTIKKKMIHFLLLISLLAGQFGYAQVACEGIYSGKSEIQKPVTDFNFETLVNERLDAKNIENLTMTVMKLTAERTAEGKDNIVGWISALRSTQEKVPLNSLEHTALLYIYSSRVFEDMPAVQSILQQSIQRSYLNLTGKALANNQLMMPLPLKVLESSGPNTKLFHDAVFSKHKDQISKEASLKLKFKKVIQHASLANVMMTLVTALAMCTQTGREIYLGLFVGLIQASLNEHMDHIGIGHAPKLVTKFFRKSGKAGSFLEEITLAHQLHHSIVSDNFGAVILTPEQKARAEATLSRLVTSLITDRLKNKNPDLDKEQIQSLPEFSSEVDRMTRELRNGNYGINGTLAGATGMLVTASPFYFLNLALYAGTGSQAFLISSTISMTVMILQSLYSHRYLHIKPEDKDLAGGNRFQQWYVNESFLGQLQQRLHFTHHEMPYSYSGTRNGAIMAGSPSDRLMGKVEDPSVKHLIKMYYQGFLPQMQKALNP